MKKLVYGVLAIAAIGMFAACQKDGKYNPKEKIANVYEEGMSIWSYTPDGEQWVSDTSITPKYLSERWTWDGNKLSQITFIEQSYVYDWENDTYTEQTYEDVVKFTYDGSQLTEAASDGERMVFTYDGKKLQKAELFSDGESTPEIAFAFEHDGKKISRFTVTEYDAIDFDVKGKPVVSRLESLLLGSVMPDAKCAEKCMTAMRKKAAKGSYTSAVDLTWDGDNIGKMTVTSGGQTATVTYTYDDKKNPYQGFVFALNGSGMSEEGLEFANENNVVKAVYKDFDGEEFTDNYTYTYDGKWPTSCTENHKSAGEYSLSIGKYTRYFEYK